MLNFLVDAHEEHSDDYYWVAHVKIMIKPSMAFMVKATDPKNIASNIYHGLDKFWPGHDYTIVSCVINGQPDNQLLQPFIQSMIDDARRARGNTEKQQTVSSTDSSDPHE